MSVPWKSTWPSTRAPGIRSFMRLKARSTVDLPQPEGPMMAVILRGMTSSVTSRMAWKAP